ncbi:phenylacetic acid degradation protein [Pedobacter yulinensis]|uniref:Phenylacetic acid degradation protein n=1 Tax=Pedobacter yulinensis TaxID=2126353 RepID=A0A2T3HPL5_9SPHI|nr:2Fe-2S iron-sulfur cluster-binding protein [Pedobacter yulinensis]PST84347.1 phenylacetic acid degradation protein [Pedobacter yulinensis]
MSFFQLKISQIIDRGSEVMEYILQPLDGEKPPYLAGQFLPLSFRSNNRELRRSYSLCSSPVVDEPLSIAVKRVENGEISRFLHHKTAVGDTLTALLPNGQFTYIPEKESRRQVFLFAAGVGIAPLFSILKTLLAAETESKAVLVYSNRSADETLFYNELQLLQGRYSNRLKIIWFFSHSKNLLMARLNNTLIRQVVESNRDAACETLFYTCGPMLYMDLCRITLLGMGIDKQRIKRETFFIAEDEADDDDATEKDVKDKNTYTVLIERSGKEYQIEVPWHKRILEVALAQQIDLPYSCQAGMCSTCTATCTAGTVRMDYNEVLTDDEVERGRVLVCTAHPTTNGTRITYP